MELQEIDLSIGEDHTHPQINTHKQYLCSISGIYSVGYFEEIKRGLLFHNAPDSAILYDKPGINNSCWNKIYQIDETLDEAQNRAQNYFYVENFIKKHHPEKPRTSKKAVKTSYGKVVLKYKTKR